MIVSRYAAEEGGDDSRGATFLCENESCLMIQKLRISSERVNIIFYGRQKSSGKLQARQESSVGVNCTYS